MDQVGKRFISSHSFSMSVDGHWRRGGGWIQLQRGSDKDAPLSPLLFVPWVDALATFTA